MRSAPITLILLLTACAGVTTPGGAAGDDDDGSGVGDDAGASGGDGAPGDGADAAAPGDDHGGASLATCSTSPCQHGTIPGYNHFTLSGVPNGDGTKATRYYAVYRPANLTGSPATVIVMGGSGGCSGSAAIGELIKPRWDDVADRDRLLIAVGECQGTSWKHINSAVPAPPPGSLTDEPYIAALIDDLIAHRGADPERIYVAGVSSGGGMAKDVACDPANAERVRAVSVWSHDGFETQISGGQVVAGTERCAGAGAHTAMQIIIGDADGQSGYADPICLSDHCFDGLLAGARYYAGVLGCAGAGGVPAPTGFGSPTAANQRYRWSGPCGELSTGAVEAVLIHGGGHSACRLDSDPGFDAAACGGAAYPTNGYFTAADASAFFERLRW